MSPNHTRFGVMALALATVLAIGGAQPARALNVNNQTRVEAAGWIFNLANDETKFGVTATTNATGAQGRFDYLNATTGFNIHGTIMSYTPVANTGCVAVGAPADIPAVELKGMCNDGSNCSFTIQVADGDKDPNSFAKHNDWVCKLEVSGFDRSGQFGSDTNPGEPLFRGNINIH